MKKYLGKILEFVSGEKKYTKKKFSADLSAAIATAIIAVPQAAAYALIAGVSAIYGVFAVFIPTILASIFGSSKHLHAGPTNSTALLVFSAIFTFSGQESTMQILFYLAIISGLIRMLMGLLRIGNVLNFVSVPVLTGFMAGAAFLIAGNQLKNLFGIDMKNSLHFYETIFNFFKNISHANLISLGLGMFTIAIIVISRKISKKIPDTFVAILLSSLACFILGLDKFGVSLVGDMPAGFPKFSFYFPNIDQIKSLLSISTAIAILGSIEALSIAKSIGSRTGQEVNFNRELIAQGISNISSGFFMGVPISGSFTRSMINFYSKAETKFSGIFSGIIVGIFLFFMAKIISFMPIPSLAGVLLMISYKMIAKKQIKMIFKCSKSDIMVFLITLSSALISELQYAVFIGVLLSIGIVLNQISNPSVLEVIPCQKTKKLLRVEKIENKACPQIIIFEMFGEFFFGSLNEISEEIRKLTVRGPRVVIFRLKGVTDIDASGLIFLKKIIKNTAEKNITFIIRGIKGKLRGKLEKTGVLDLLGKENFVYSTEKAIKRALSIINKEKCINCEIKSFKECNRKNFIPKKLLKS